MPAETLELALKSSIVEPELGRALVEIWPFLESLCSAFAEATSSTALLAVNDVTVYQSDARSNGNAPQASSSEPQSEMISWQSLPVDSIADIKLGYKAGLANHILIERRDLRGIYGALAEAICLFLRLGVDFRVAAIGLTHEVSLMLNSLGLLALSMNQDPKHLLPIGEKRLEVPYRREEHILREVQLAQYLVRNFLSNASEVRYKQAVNPRFDQVRLSEVLNDMVDLYGYVTYDKGIQFDVVIQDELPVIVGQEMEIRRLIHNLLSNAAKYSYHSVGDATRYIRVRARIHDPASTRIAIAIGNYGLGLDPSEIQNVFQAGFRGRQAIAAHPIGAGLGLAEAYKIARQHGGHIRITSTLLHRSKDQDTYATEATVILPIHQAHQTHP